MPAFPPNKLTQDIMNNPLLFTRRGAVAIISINDAPRNRMTLEFIDELEERVEEIASSILAALPEKFALAGLSMGGIVAMEILRRAPQRVLRIALLDTNPLAETPATAAAYEPWIVGAKAGRLEDILGEVMRPEYLAPGARFGGGCVCTSGTGTATPP